MTEELSRPVARVIWTIGVTASAYHLWTGWFGVPIAELHRPLHLFLVLALVGVTSAGGGFGDRPWRIGALTSAAIIAAGGVASLYITANASEIQNRIFYVYDLVPIEKVLGFGLLIALSEAARRTLGLAIVILLWVFIAYAFLGQFLPPAIGHRGFSDDRVIELVYITKDGIWGAPLGIAATFMFMFILFGALLASTGASSFFNELSVRATARWAGGPAKAAIVASAFMSMLSGNAASNVATTGTVTIPAMKRAGYGPAFAGGVEAVASSGGQITPPVMGAAAFLIVEFVGIPYGAVMAAAVGPALLYFIALFAMVHFEARRLGLASRPPQVGAEGAGRTPLLVHGLTVVASLCAILYMLFSGYTPTTAALFGIITLLVAVLMRMVLWGEPRIRDVFGGLAEAPRMIAPVSIACAIGGVIAGITILTGLGSKVSDLVIALSGGYVSAALLLTMIVAIIMGMGLPSSSAYIILAALLAPTLIRMGVDELPTHMFILFCGVSSTITPPVAIASYTAAAIAGADPWRTSLIAFRLGVSIYIIPFMFVAHPGLLMQGELPTIVMNMATAIAGVIALSAAVIGHSFTPINLLQRLAYLAASLLLIAGGAVTDAVGGTLLVAGASAEFLRTAGIRVLR